MRKLACLGKGDLGRYGPFGFKLGFVRSMSGISTGLKLYTVRMTIEDDQYRDFDQYRDDRARPTIHVVPADGGSRKSSCRRTHNPLRSSAQPCYNRPYPEWRL
jgi:hypothetical protein